MRKLVAFVRSLQLTRMLTILVVGVALFLTTACNNGDIRGARPENPPVQMGGQNNPYKQGGDGYTQYKTSTDPRVNDANAHKGGYFNRRLGG
jgi:predicted small secreted protein